MGSVPAERFTKEQALAIFGVTAEELAELDRDGYVAAREAAHRARSDFQKYLRERLEAGFQRAFDGGGTGDPIGP